MIPKFYFNLNSLYGEILESLNLVIRLWVTLSTLLVGSTILKYSSKTIVTVHI